MSSSSTISLGVSFEISPENKTAWRTRQSSRSTQEFSLGCSPRKKSNHRRRVSASGFGEGSLLKIILFCRFPNRHRGAHHDTFRLTMLNARTDTQNDLGRLPQIPHLSRTTSRTDSRTRRIVVGCQGRLGASTRIRPAGRRQGWLVGSRVPSSQRGRSGQRGILV